MRFRGAQPVWAYIAVSIGGIIGCCLRYGQATVVQAIYGRDFPYATLSINVIGSFLMGFLFIATVERVTISPELRAGILTGFLGGYTTFSTFSMESLLLIEQGEAPKAILYLILSVALGMLAAFSGAYIARNL